MDTAVEEGWRTASNNNNRNNNDNDNNNGGGGRGVERGGYNGGGRGRGGGRGGSQGGEKGIPPLKNGEKGADAHTVSESERIRFTKLLMTLREGDEPCLEMPSTLTNTERKFLHELAGQLGLVSKSTGKGETRHIKVTKRADAKRKRQGDGDEDDLPVLRIGKSGVQALQTHVGQFPPTHAEALESRETGASLVEVLTQQQHDSAIAATLTQLGLGDDNKGVVQHQPRKRHVNLQARAARHAHYQTKKKHTQQAKAQYHKMQQVRANLPAYAREAEIVATVAANPVTILQGETGCGKSTQCPQFLLDAIPTANIVVTQRT